MNHCLGTEFWESAKVRGGDQDLDNLDVIFIPERFDAVDYGVQQDLFHREWDRRLWSRWELAAAWAECNLLEAVWRRFRLVPVGGFTVDGAPRWALCCAPGALLCRFAGGPWDGWRAMPDLCPLLFVDEPDLGDPVWLWAEDSPCDPTSTVGIKRTTYERDTFHTYRIRRPSV